MSAELWTTRVTVNGTLHLRDVPVRMLLSDFLRHELRLTGTHVGCEHGVCGACTVLLDGEPVRACLVLAVSADGSQVETVEGLAGQPGQGHEGLHPVQRAFIDCHGLQCGFCTPGFVMAIAGQLRDNASSTDAELDECIAGHLCRCTGYENIRKAARRARELTAIATDDVDHVEHVEQVPHG